MQRSASRQPAPSGFARVSPLFLAIVLTLLSSTSSTAASSSPNATTGRNQAASAQFTRAEDQRAALDDKPQNKRTLAEYKQVVNSYRRVYLITPHAAEVPEALMALGELYTEMGDRFGASYYQSATESYRFLLKEYPTSKHGQDAMLLIAHLQRNQLGDAASASKTFQEFLKKYPRSKHRREAQESLAELALLRNATPAPDVPKTQGKAPSAAESARDDSLARETSAEAHPDDAPSTAGPGGAPRVRRISTTSSADSTRVLIDLEDTVQYSSARIRNPDRIFFDLHTARLTPELTHSNIHIEGSLLTAVRVAQNQVGVVRVVLDVTGVKDYTASLLESPPALAIDLYPEGAPARTAKAKAGRAPDDDEEPVTRDRRPPGEDSPAAQPVAARGGNSTPATNPRARSVKGAKPDLIQPPAVAKPTRDGQSTLTRALGLKIGRIVIDAGHGGHDTGTIGPTGLMEKDLCLDISLRLGKIIQQRLPSAEVVYTRSDDTFVPLEDRTRIANEAKADLFISIHANSSRDHAARGIETYYLNLKGSPDAMEVASRENASAQESIHDLEDLVKKIARSEKIDESREFAADIQESLAKRVQKANKNVKDRGVRKAPFVVLIGADMPSVLTEISFLSNPADEQLLKKPDHRQKLAEGLYQGVASYLQNLNSVTLNLPRLPAQQPAKRSAALASVEQSRNPQ